MFLLFGGAGGFDRLVNRRIGMREGVSRINAWISRTILSAKKVAFHIPVNLCMQTLINGLARTVLKGKLPVAED